MIENGHQSSWFSQQQQPTLHKTLPSNYLSSPYFEEYRNGGVSPYDNCTLSPPNGDINPNKSFHEQAYAQHSYPNFTEAQEISNITFKNSPIAEENVIGAVGARYLKSL